MIFSINKLNQMAGVEKNVKEIASALNTIGFEVEGYSKFSNIESLKFGKLKNIYKNPNADKLWVCEIIFSDKERIIQTNSEKVSKSLIGKYVVAFVPGSRKNDMIFEEKQLKGIVSEGMLAGWSELGFSSHSIDDGIVILNDIDIKANVNQILELDDYLIDVDILSNRSDANSYYILGHELAAYFKSTPVKFASKKIDVESKINVDESNATTLVVFETNNDITLPLSDLILLMKHGIKPSMPMSDLANLSLIMTGQPTQAYDADKIGHNFSATSNWNGKMETPLGDYDVKSALVIWDGKKAISAAGIIGFTESEIKPETKKVILELGIFNIKEVRETARQIKATTDCSRQSSKILTKGTTKIAYDFLSTKLNVITKPKTKMEFKNEKVKYDKKELDKIAGFPLSKTKEYLSVIQSLETLDFVFEDGYVLPPPYRHDITNQQDIEEEILRFYGYSKLIPVAPKQVSTTTSSINKIQYQASSLGYREVKTYTLISKKRNNFNPFAWKEEIVLSTLYSKEREVIRHSMAHSLLEVFEHNMKRKITDMSIWEKGMISNGRFVFSIASTQKTFKEMKEDILNLFGNHLEFARSTYDSLHPGVSALIKYKGEMLGWIGKVHPSLTNNDAFIAEILLPKKNLFAKYEEYDPQPLKTRDINVELNAREDIKHEFEKLHLIKGVYEISIKDTFIKGDLVAITFKILCNEEASKIIDAEY